MSICIGERVQRLSVLFNKITHVEISKRWLIVLFAGSIMLGNHYARDAVGALEIQMESDLSITATQYATINSVYFIPSVIAPLLAGIATEYLGGAAKCLFYSVFFGSLGHIIFSLGIQFDSMELIFLGRSVAGFMYEIIDSVPIVVLHLMFDSQWGLVLGLLNGFLRLGSVMNFVISPIIYTSSGVKAALWFATAMASLSTLFAIAIIYVLGNGDKLIGSIGYERLDISGDIELESSSSIKLDTDSSVLKVVAQGDEHDIEGQALELDKSPHLGIYKGYAPIATPMATVCNGENFSLADDKDIEIADTSRILTEDVLVFSQEIGVSHRILEDNSLISTNVDDIDHAISTKIVKHGSIDIEIEFSLLSRIRLFGTVVKNSIISALPLHLFTYQFYMFLFSGACLYGAMVPFWFLGSKFLQDNYALSVTKADALMLFPEGLIAVISTPMGIILDRLRYSTKYKLQLLAAVLLSLPLSYLMLAHGFYFRTTNASMDTLSTDSTNLSAPSVLHSISQVLISPFLSMFVIGLAYGTSNSLYWNSVLDILPKGPNFAAANGLIASCLNILPSVIPPFLVFVSSLVANDTIIYRLFPMYLLSGLGICASGFALLASLA